MVGDESLRRVERDDAPADDHADAITEAFRLVHEVGDEHDGRTPLADPADEVPRDAPGRGVEPGRHLVEEHDLGLVQERERDEQPLLLAA